MKNKRKQKKARPPRLFVTKTGRPYIIVKKKRIYLKATKDIDSKKLVNIVINNFKKQNKQQNRGSKKVLDTSSSYGFSTKADYLNFLNHTF